MLAIVANLVTPVKLAKVPTVVTGAKAGVPDRSVYLPEVATVASEGCPVRMD